MRMAMTEMAEVTVQAAGWTTGGKNGEESAETKAS